MIPIKDYWKSSNSEVEFIGSRCEPEGLPVTAVKIFIFDKENKLLLVKNNKGWDIPGGHIEDGESPIDALGREVKEETGSELIHSKLVGYLKITNKKPNSNNLEYPKVSCILIYKGSVTIKLTKLKHEVTSVKYFAHKDLKKYIPNSNNFTENVIKYLKDISLD